jgi:glycosyltransferase involved in cell wall biosynthesis
MKIIHFSKSDDKGAFLAAYRFHQQLLEAGHTSVMLVAKKTKLEPQIIEVELNYLQKLKLLIIKLISKVLIKRTIPLYAFYNYFEETTFPISAIKKALPFTPDVICIHWITGFVNTKTIYLLHKESNAPVFWRFNDFNAFTGGCHYVNNCINYTKSCGNCPAILSKRLKDRSYQNLQTKIKWLNKTNVTFVSSTTEIDEQLKSSIIAKFTKTQFIMLSCNSNAFMPFNKNKAAKKLGLPENKKIIFFGAQNINDARKGFKELLLALNILKTKLSKIESTEILLAYASKNKIDEDKLPFNCIRLPFFNSDKELAFAYQAATLFVSPSIQDAGPMMIVEAMYCGTPVVAFDIGLAKDAIVNNYTGYIAPMSNNEAFANGIYNLIKLNEGEYNAVSENCLKFANEKFDPKRELVEYENNRLYFILTTTYYFQYIILLHLIF